MEDQKKPEFFNEVKNELLKMSSAKNKIDFLEKKQLEYQQNNVNPFNMDISGVKQKFELEIRYWEKQLEKEQPRAVPPSPKEKPITPIWWKKSDRLLKYLMDELARLDYINRESHVNKHIKEHFINRDQNPFTDSIKQNSSGAGANKGTGKNQKAKPKDHEEIDSLINSLKDQQDRLE